MVFLVLLLLVMLWGWLGLLVLMRLVLVVDGVTTNQCLAWCCSPVRSVLAGLAGLAVHYKIITAGELRGLVSISSDNGAAPA